MKATLELVDPSLIDYDKETSTVSFKKDGVQIDLGGIAKGYTSSRIMDIYKEKGVTSGLVNLGGNAQVFGTKPDDSLWRVAVQSPDSEDEYLGVLETKDKAIITSGGYERYFEKDGVRYHHILDPRTGYPADSGLMQVTIICDDSVIGDALSTACFVLGLDEGMNLAAKYGVNAIFVDTDKNIWYNNPDVLNYFEFTGKDSGYVLNEYNQARS